MTVTVSAGKVVVIMMMMIMMMSDRERGGECDAEGE